MQRILVVDHVELNRTLFGALLRKAGYAVLLAADGVEALQIIRRDQPDIALVSLDLPVMNGLSLARAVRAGTPPSSAMPILALTADLSETTLAACLEAGMKGCIDKAVRPVLLPGIVASHLAHPGTTAADVVANEIAERLRPKQLEARSAASEQLEAFLTDCRRSDSDAWLAVGRIAHNLAGSSALFGDHELAAQALAVDRMVASRFGAGRSATSITDDMLAALYRLRDVLRRSLQEVTG